MRQPKDPESSFKIALIEMEMVMEKSPSQGYINEERIIAVEAVEEIRC